MEGYITILHLAAYFFLVTAVFRTHREWRLLFNVFLGVGVVIGIYAVFQKAGIAEILIPGQTRIDGTMGNPLYLAAFLTLLIGIGAVEALQTKKKWQTWIYSFMAIFFACVIVLTESRGATLGIGMGLGIVAMLLLKNKILSRNSFAWKVMLGVIVVLIILPSLLLLGKNTKIVQSTPLINRIASISLTEGTLHSRLLVWNIAWEGFKERPLLGWGQENFPTVFAKHYNAELYSQESWFDRAHNSIFDWLINAGLLGLLAYISMFFTAVIMLWKTKNNTKKEKIEKVIITGTLGAYAIQNLFIFETIIPYITLFALFSTIHARGIQRSETSEKQNGNIILSAGVGVVCLALMSWIIIVGTLRPMAQNQQAIITLQKGAEKTMGIEELKEEIQKSLAPKTFGTFEIAEVLSSGLPSIVENQEIPQDEKGQVVMLITNAMEEEIMKGENNIRMQQILGELYLRTRKIDTTFLEKGHIYTETVLQKNPKQKEAIIALANYYQIIEDQNQAIREIKKLTEFNPQWVKGYMYIALFAIKASEFEEADKAVDAIVALPLDVGDRTVSMRVGDAFIERGEFSRALRIYEHALVLDSKNPQTWANAAGLYLNRGQFEKAKSAALRAVELDPKNFEEAVEVFLKQLP